MIVRPKMTLRGVCALMLIVLGLSPVAAAAAAAEPAAAPKRVTIDVLAERQTVAPGEEIWIALREQIAPGWHTYWTNPGDSGETTTVSWQLPAGVTAGPLQFPLPSAIPVGPLVNYGYAGEVLLLSRLTIPKNAPFGPLDIKANAEWLVCKDICIPESGTAQVKVEVTSAAATRSSAAAGQIAAAVASLPAPAPWPVRMAVGADTIDLTFAGLGGAGAKRLDSVTFFSQTWGHIQHAGPQTLTWSGNDLSLRLQRGDLKKEALAGLAGLLVLEGGASEVPRRRGFAVVAGTVAPQPTPGAGASQSVTAAFPASAAPILAKPPADDTSLLKALLFAVLGGLILNLMPCVFPVLSLKAVSLARQDRSALERRNDGLAYLAGVLASFATLAMALLAVRHAGQNLGWGFQFQSPVFVLLMAGLFFVLGLTLSGVVTFGGALAGAGDALAQRAGPAGAFFTGALATVAATPCTAPFMGAAVGYALTASAISGFVVLMAMGLGFATPIVALSIAPGLQRLLPRPGRWMDTFKQVMAFPLYASAAWMVWVLSLQAGSDGVLAAMVLLVGLGFLAWVWSCMAPTSVPSRNARSGVATVFANNRAAVVAAATLILTGFALGLIGDKPSGSASDSSAAGSLLQTDVTGLPIIPFSVEKIAALQQEGRPVFVNLTAAWCITCKVNEKVALSSERMRAAFTGANMAYVKGDWTRRDPAISAFLQAFGRAGVPLYLLYPPKAGAAPRVLDQVLTEGSVLAELRSALE